MLKLTAYGGVGGNGENGEIGGNKLLLEWDDHAYFLDFGTRFSVSGKYFEEFLKPRAALGLRDYLRMGLLPPLEGILRADLTAHDPQLWERYRDHPDYRRIEHLDGVLLSHGHVDHNGNLGFLEPDIPVYTGLMTAIIGKGMEDCSSVGPDREYSYIAPREPAGTGVLKTANRPRIGRPHFVCEDSPDILASMEKLQRFWATVPGPRTQIRSRPLEKADVSSMGIRFFRVDHSIPGSGAFAIDTPIGWVAYSGDLRLHGHSKHRTQLFAEELAALRPTVLVVEGTHLNPEAAVEEPTVKDAAAEVVKKEPGMVIADFSPRNIERLRTFHDIAMDHGRRLVVTTRDAYLLQQMNVVDPAIPLPDGDSVTVLKEPAATYNSWEKLVLARCRDATVDAESIRAEPAAYILCLSFWDISNLIDLEPDGGTYIYSSSEAYSEEQSIDQRRLAEWLRRFRLRPIGGLPGAEDGPYHASGHMDGPGMEWLIETINPEKIVPVHTQLLDWFGERWPGKVVPAEYGKPLVFD